MRWLRSLVLRTRETSREKVRIQTKYRNVPVEPHLLAYRPGKRAERHDVSWMLTVENTNQVYSNVQTDQVSRHTHTHTFCIYIFAHSVHSTFLLGRWWDEFTADWLLIGKNRTLCVPWIPENVSKVALKSLFLLQLKTEWRASVVGSPSTNNYGFNQENWRTAFQTLINPKFLPLGNLSSGGGSEEDICFFCCWALRSGCQESHVLKRVCRDRCF